MTEIDKITQELLSLSASICNTMQELEELSAYDLEESDDFDTYIEILKKYLYEETNILNSTSKESLNIILQNLYHATQTTKQNYIAKNRSCINIEDYINDLMIKEYEELDDEDDEDDETYNYNNVENIFENEDKLFDIGRFYVDDEDIQIYKKYVINRIAMRAIKNMYIILNTAETDNSIDRNYQKELIYYFKRFKYTIFTIDNDLEKLGAKYHFNIHIIPDIEKIDIDTSPICYNECVDILDRLYALHDNERNISEISNALFDMACFDEYIADLSEKYINKLIYFCCEMESKISKNFFGNCGFEKLVKIKKKKN